MVGRINVAVVCVLGLVLAAVAGQVAAKDIDPVGRPDNWRKGDKKTQVAIWYEDGKWHVRAATGGNKKLIGGTVKVQGGSILRVDGEGIDLPQGGHLNNPRGRKMQRKEQKTSDRFEMHAESRGFDVTFVNAGQNDGLSFVVSPRAETITVGFGVDGDDNPKQVVIGKWGVSPEKLPVVLPAHPGKTPPAKNAPKTK